jgi:hypothetical protein
MRYRALEAQFIAINRKNQIESISFKDMEFGKAILKAMEANDKRE